LPRPPASQAVGQTAPEYPPAAKEKGIEGDVVLLVTIDEGGRATEATFASGPEVFHESAWNAVRVWKWAPAKKDGRPVACRSEIRINYRLK
jgi:TonB family protein